MLRTTCILASIAFVLALLLARAAPVDAGTALKLDVPGLVSQAELAFEGRVLAARTTCDARGLVSTEYTVSVHRTYWGEPFGTRVFSLPGGVLPDGSGLVLAGMPRIDVGEDVLLFLSAASANGLRMPVGLAQGKFKIVRDAQGLASLVRTQADLMLVDPTTGSTQPAAGWSALDYQATVGQIETAAALKAAAQSEARR
jgi:hypothetical protein